MATLGRIEQWNDDRGYGFVRPLESLASDDASSRAFVHIKAIERAGRRPANGDLIRYDVEHDGKGRRNAVAVSFVNASAMRATAQARTDARSAARERRDSGRRASILRRVVGAAATAGLVGGWVLDLWPVVVPIVYAAMSLLSFLAYRHDKIAAGLDRRRTPEKTLHLLDLLCGWPGGLIAQQVFRHKTGKASFQFVFWCTVALNGVALFLLARSGTLESLRHALHTT